jgi:hypothetical protein
MPQIKAFIMYSLGARNVVKRWIFTKCDKSQGNEDKLAHHKGWEYAESFQRGAT